MLPKRIIPCLDLKDGRVVKGVSFVDLKDAGDPVELAARYEKEGADELVLLDISATNEGRRTILDIVEKIAQKITIPFTVGGGVRSLEDMERVLNAGAHKVSLNTAAISQPSLIQIGAQNLGSQCIVVAIDAKYNPVLGSWEVYTQGGNQNTGLDVVVWAQEAAKLGAGEILLTSMDCDGHKGGYDLELTQAVCESVPIPVIASGGAGSKDDFWEVFQKTGASAALAASIFHYQETSIKSIKNYLGEKGLLVSA